jgi:hypothetical protein
MSTFPLPAYSDREREAIAFGYNPDAGVTSGKVAAMAHAGALRHPDGQLLPPFECNEGSVRRIASRARAARRREDAKASTLERPTMSASILEAHRGSAGAWLLQPKQVAKPEPTVEPPPPVQSPGEWMREQVAKFIEPEPAPSRREYSSGPPTKQSSAWTAANWPDKPLPNPEAGEESKHIRRGLADWGWTGLECYRHRG